jgi:lipoprotein-releasing system permease protein
MMFYLLFFIVIVAAFGIMSALITFVVQKTREIGMLKALGAQPFSIAILFLGQSLVVGVLGVVTGLAVGLTALAFRNEFLRFMNERLGFNLFPPSVYLFRELPAKTVSSDVFVICFFSLFFCLLAGVLPAVRAAWLSPVKALRNE